MRFLKSLFAFALISATLLAVALIAALLWINNEAAKPGPNDRQIEFVVENGDAFSNVTRRLQQSGVVESSLPLRLKARLGGLESKVKAGSYMFPAFVTPNEVLDMLINGRVIELKLTIPEGLTTAQILRRVKEASDLIGEMPTQTYAEGSLLPDTYVFGAGTTRTQFLERMSQAQTAFLENAWQARADDIPIKTPEEALILASVVEKETAHPEERPLVAGLFTTRLKRGMRLESDPTIIYGISGGEPLVNKLGQRRTLYRSEIDRRTDWNTYQIDGLPKTPICNPGRDAILAVLNPPDTEYLFFVADGKGGHLFAETYAEHQKNVAAYRAYEAAEIKRERED